MDILSNMAYVTVPTLLFQEFAGKIKKKKTEKKGKVIGWGREGLNLQKLSSSLLVCPSASSANCAPDPGPPVPLKRMQVDVKVGGNGDEGDVWPGQR
jgi:hypothetical protein